EAQPQTAAADTEASEPTETADAEGMEDPAPDADMHLKALEASATAALDASRAASKAAQDAAEAAAMAVDAYRRASEASKALNAGE
ncbi:MAG: hypothetical protein VXW58_03890, partial [Pseudomonadota bacterium]|nr:hypothetical protein [Pseudomonadota bacterium]